jgi:hypothetical protein
MGKFVHGDRTDSISNKMLKYFIASHKFQEAGLIHSSAHSHYLLSRSLIELRQIHFVKIILKTILEKYNGMVWTRLFWLRIGANEGLL